MANNEPMQNKIDYSLYLVTDRELMTTEKIEECVEQAIKGGCTMVQLREKTSSREFYQTALQVQEVTKRQNVPLIINDRIDIALAVDADGVHIGQNDLPYEAVRRVVGQNKIVGISVSNITEAYIAADQGADYLGVGAMFFTETKTDAHLVDMEELRNIRNSVSIPIIVIGGINEKTIPLFKNIGIDGVAVISAIVSKKNIKSASRKLKTLIMEVKR